MGEIGYMDFLKWTSAERRFNIRFFDDGRVLEWPIDGDVSDAWVGSFESGVAKGPNYYLFVVIGEATTEYKEDFGVLQGVERIGEEEVARSEIYRRDYAVGLNWFQGRGVKY